MIKVPTYYGLSGVAQFYDAFIVDVWGVLHDGRAPYPGVLDCLDMLRTVNKTVILLSNAPRPADSVARRLAEIGISDDLYGGIMTSGEEVHYNLLSREDPWYAELGERIFLLGTERDLVVLEDVQGELVADVADADFIVATGTMLGNSVEAHEALLSAAFDRRLRMICANPDLVVIHGGVAEICAGALAQRYEEMGGEVRYHGKPHESVYESCLDSLHPIPYTRIAAIGDGLRTDIAGAAAVGLSGVFITSGIHAEDLGVEWGAMPNRQGLSDLFEAVGVTPTMAMPAFRW
jgi:HAD superfamily hydrolase (TIGR01459 family)